MNADAVVTIKRVLTEAASQLVRVTVTPQLDAALLLAHVLQKSRTYLHAWPEKSLTSEDQRQFAELLHRRLQGEPLAYLTGSRDFWSLDLRVNSHTLIPRPETELLVECALHWFTAHDEKKVIADLGTGSGAIALAIAKERPHWRVHATDWSAETLQVAMENARRLDIRNIEFSQCDWCASLPRIRFDAIVSNPPYLSDREWPEYAEGLAFEPRSALVSGDDGLNAIKIIIHDAPNYLQHGGWLCLEHGYQQGEQVRSLMSQQGFQDIKTHRDLAGLERVTAGRFILL